MESYDLVSNKVQDMTDAYKELASQFKEKPFRSSSCQQKRRPRSSHSNKSKSHGGDRGYREKRDAGAWRIDDAFRNSGVQKTEIVNRMRDSSDARSVFRCSDGKIVSELGSVCGTLSASPAAIETTDIHSDRNARHDVDISNLRRAVDELEEKTHQCWLEISDVRDIQTKRHRRARQRFRQITEEQTQCHASAESREKFISGQIFDLSKQLTAIEKSLRATEEARRKADGKTSKIEVYVNQVNARWVCVLVVDSLRECRFTKHANRR